MFPQATPTTTDVPATERRITFSSFFAQFSAFLRQQEALRERANRFFFGLSVFGFIFGFAVGFFLRSFF